MTTYVREGNQSDFRIKNKCGKFSIDAQLIEILVKHLLLSLLSNQGTKLTMPAKHTLISFIFFVLVCSLQAKESKVDTAAQEKDVAEIVAAGILGAIAVPVIAAGAAALIPVAMATFGTVAVGVGTTHASLAAGGCAAMLQSTAATLLTAKAVATGAAIGVSIGAFAKSTEGTESTEKPQK